MVSLQLKWGEIHLLSIRSYDYVLICKFGLFLSAYAVKGLGLEWWHMHNIALLSLIFRAKPEKFLPISFPLIIIF